MDIKLLILFIVCNFIYAITHNLRNVALIKGSSFSAALWNAIDYGFYAVVVMYLICELPLEWKVGIIAICNFVGIYVVKWIEKKFFLKNH